MSTSAFEGWAIVEMMGHRRIAGRVSETEIAGAKLLRVDVPGDGPEDFCTQFIGGAAIYCLTPTGEKEARAAAASTRPAPVTRFELPEPKSVAPAHNASTCGGSGECGHCAEADEHDEEEPRAHDVVLFDGPPLDGAPRWVAKCRNCECKSDPWLDSDDARAQMADDPCEPAPVDGGMEEQPDGTTHFEEAATSLCPDCGEARVQCMTSTNPGPNWMCLSLECPSIKRARVEAIPPKCPACRGEGRVANSDDQEPWSAWSSLPPGSDVAVRMGIVSPIDCPKCKGTGKAS